MSIYYLCIAKQRTTRHSEFGLRRGRSIADMVFGNRWLCEHQRVSIEFLGIDLSRAFDTIHGGRLLQTHQTHSWRITTAYANHNIIFISSSHCAHQGSRHRIFHLQSVISSASSSVTSITAMSSLTASIYLILGLPRFLFTVSSRLSILLPIYPSSFLAQVSKTTSVLPVVFSLQTVPAALM